MGASEASPSWLRCIFSGPTGVCCGTSGRRWAGVDPAKEWTPPPGDRRALIYCCMDEVTLQAGDGRDGAPDGQSTPRDRGGWGGSSHQVPRTRPSSRSGAKWILYTSPEVREAIVGVTPAADKPSVIVDLTGVGTWTAWGRDPGGRAQFLPGLRAAFRLAGLGETVPPGVPVRNWTRCSRIYPSAGEALGHGSDGRAEDGAHEPRAASWGGRHGSRSMSSPELFARLGGGPRRPRGAGGGGASPSRDRRPLGLGPVLRQGLPLAAASGRWSGSGWSPAIVFLIAGSVGMIVRCRPPHSSAEWGQPSMWRIWSACRLRGS